MTDGHCAATSEVLFVEFNAAGCPNADGTSAKPYCAPNHAVAHLSSARNVIVIRGAVNNQMALATSGVSPVVVGRKSSSGTDGSILAGPITALTISSDAALVRDLILNAGNTATSRGLLVTGASTHAMLLRLTSSIGTGLGIDAEAGATLQMDRCLVLNNSAGGVLINGAGYDIQNSVIAGNGLNGVKFTAAAGPVGSQFRFNTLVATSGNAVSCDPGNPQTVAASIVAGGNDSCAVSNSLTSAPAFDTSRPYHLTAKLPCPTGDPATFPDHDLDGDPRTKPLDCGADQYFP